MIELQRAIMVDDVIGRTLEGVAVSYGRTYRVSDDGGATFYREGWRSAAFSSSIRASRNTFELRRQHADERLGIVSFEDSEDSLTFTATLDESEAGDAALELVETGKLRAVSLGFRPRRQERDATGTVWRNQADIRELSLSPRGQYADAKVLATREAPDRLEEARKFLLEARAAFGLESV